MPAPFHIYPVNPIPGAIYSLIVTNIDFGLTLYGEFEGEFFSVDKFTLQQLRQNNAFPRLTLTRKYLIRYNNNDGGSGNLNIDLVQFIPEQRRPLLIQQFNLNSIIGPRVIEIPFILAPQPPQNV
jgi:hypothetical protein